MRAKTGFSYALTSGICHYAGFRGRASRSEFWWWQLVTSALAGGLQLVQIFGGDGPSVMGVSLLSSLSVLWLLPSLAVTVRRFHDVDRPITWVLVPLGLALLAGVFSLSIAFQPDASSPLPTFGELPTLTPLGDGAALAALVCGVACAVTALRMMLWTTQHGTKGPNRFGPDPLAMELGRETVIAG